MVKMTFPGGAWAGLRDDQKEYVQHLMSSWRAYNCFGGFHRRMLNRAIKKARINRP